MTDMITANEINEIMYKYSIGKKPLSLILGLGEINIIRYLNGSNPTKEISNLLKNILNNPFLYELYLETNKDKITELAYKKSLSQTKQLEFNYDNKKIYNVLLCIVNYIKEIDTISIHRLLYFINGFSNNILKEKLFEDIPEVREEGPIYKEIYDCLNYFNAYSNDYDKLFKKKELCISNEEQEYIEYITYIFGCYSGAFLREMTKMTEPWIKATVGLENIKYSNRKIESTDMDGYFDKVCEEYNIRKMQDIEKYSRNLLKKTQKKFLKH